jgi:hypothetical protein
MRKTRERGSVHEVAGCYVYAKPFVPGHLFAIGRTGVRLATTLLARIAWLVVRGSGNPNDNVGTVDSVSLAVES